MVYGLWFMVYGLWFMVYGLWFMVYGLWFMVYGLWFMVYGLAHVACERQTLKPGYHFVGSRVETGRIQGMGQVDSTCVQPRR
jgi:hypothetical protein